MLLPLLTYTTYLDKKASNKICFYKYVEKLARAKNVADKKKKKNFAPIHVVMRHRHCTDTVYHIRKI
jgi:surface antigen